MPPPPPPPPPLPGLKGPSSLPPKFSGPPPPKRSSGAGISDRGSARVSAPTPPPPQRSSATILSSVPPPARIPPQPPKRQSGTGLSNPPPSFAPSPSSVSGGPPPPPKRSSGTQLSDHPVKPSPPVLPKRNSKTVLSSAPPSFDPAPPPPTRLSGTQLSSVPPPPPVMSAIPPPPPVMSAVPPLPPVMSTVPPPPPVMSAVPPPPPVISAVPPPPPVMSAVPPPPPVRSAVPPPPPVPQHSPKRRSQHLDSQPNSLSPHHPPTLQFSGMITPSSPSEIPPPPVVLRNSPSSGSGSNGNTPPPPPQRLSRQSAPLENAVPPAPPTRRSSTKRLSNTTPPTRDSTNYTAIQSGIKEVSSENGFGDYDIPRPTKHVGRYGDYDMPQPKPSLPQPQMVQGSLKARQQSSDRDSDYDVPLTKEERLRKEKVLSMLAAKQRYSVDDSSSDHSRPVSVNSSVYSVDSASLNSSRSSSKLTLQTRDSDLVGASGPQTQSNFDIEVDELIEDVAQLKRDSSEGLSKNLSSVILSHLDEGGSSNSGSNDNLGVWDDISYEEDDSDEASGGEGVPPHSNQEEETLLDSWIKELESGIQGMVGVTGLEPNQVLDATLDNPPPTAPAPPPPVISIAAVPPVPDNDSPQKSNEGGSNRNSTELVFRNRLSSKTEKEMSRVETWRLSMRAIEDAEDPDLDLLLADLCQLEEDTKAQLASSSVHKTNGSNVEESSLPPLSPSSVLIKGNDGGGMSSDEFVQFMEGLQDQRNVIIDLSKSVSTGTYDSNKRTSPVENNQLDDMLSNLVNESDPQDIFSRESQLIRRNSSSQVMSNSSSIHGRTSSFRRSKKISSPSGLKDDVTVVSPTHGAIQKDLDDFANRLTVDESLTPEQQATRLKNEKLKIAMMKLKEASVHKMVLKVYNVDGSTKMVAIHEGMNARDVCILLAERNHQEIGPNWTLMEKLADLHLERTLEDHEKVLRCLTHWPRTHNNSILFKNNPEKYYILKRPQLLMPASHAYSSFNATRTTFTEEQKKNIILKELFVTKMLPKQEGDLYIREGKKSSWKKHLFVLRASGLYYSKTGKSLSSKDIVRVVEWKDVEVYSGTQYKKFYRAPGSYCFSLVPHGPLQKVDKQIIHLCAGTRNEVLSWITGIRLAKHGNQLLANYDDTKAEMPWLQLEDDNLDQSKIVLPSPKKTSVEEVAPVVIMHDGKEVDYPKKSKSSTVAFRGSSKFISENGSPQVVSNEGDHNISGPLSSENRKKTRANSSILANVFQNAWKQGSLAIEMNQDSEKWPVFEQYSSKSKDGSNNKQSSASGQRVSAPYLMEETDSGMFTLRKKKDKESSRVQLSASGLIDGAQTSTPVM